MGKKAHFSQPLHATFQEAQPDFLFPPEILPVDTNKPLYTFEGVPTSFWPYVLFFFHKRLDLYLHLLSLSQALHFLFLDVPCIKRSSFFWTLSFCVYDLSLFFSACKGSKGRCQSSWEGSWTRQCRWLCWAFKGTTSRLWMQIKHILKLSYFTIAITILYYYKNIILI